jgi:serine palmitoyltransferase
MGVVVNEAVAEFSSQLITAVNTTFNVFNKVYEVIPGSNIVYKYVRASYQNDPQRSLLELLLVVFMLWYHSTNTRYSFKKTKVKGQASEIKLSAQEVEELVQEWKPEPLVPTLSADQRQELEKSTVMIAQAGLKTKGVDGRERLNFSSYNFLGFMNCESIKERAIQALRKYGVGSCGPGSTER